MRQVVGGDGTLYIGWQPARDRTGGAIRAATYAIYTATESGEQDFDRPRQVTGTGATETRLESLVNGQPIYVVVRARTPDLGEDRNRAEWVGVPNSVRYVSRSAPAGGDGRTPRAPLRTILEAIESTISESGVNIYVTTGEYLERIFLFEGVALYGGFADDFDLSARHPARQQTTLVARNAVDQIVVAPGISPCALDGFVVRGAGVGRRGVIADDSTLWISHVTVSRFLEKGIELRSGSGSGDRITGGVRDSTITGNAGEGVLLEGGVALTLRRLDIRENGQEGVEARFTVGRRRRSTFEMDRCHLARNHDLGLKLSLAPHSPGESDGGKFRIDVHDSAFIGNDDYGADLDVRFDDSEQIDLRIEFEGNRVVGNGKAGLLLDSDAAGGYRVAHCDLLENREGGIRCTGDSPYPLIRVTHCNIRKNHGAGILHEAAGYLVVRQSLFEANDPRAIAGSDRGSQVVGCVIRSHEEGLEAGELRRCARIDEPLPRAAIERDGVSNTAQLPDSGMPEEVDGDGSRADIGPDGGFLAERKGQKMIELQELWPPPGAVVPPHPAWTLRFSKDLTADLRFTLTSAGRVLPCAVDRVDDKTCRIRCSEALAPGAPLQIELPPTTGGRRQPWQHLFSYRAGLELPAPGSRVAPGPTAGELSLKPQDSPHRYEVDLRPGAVLTARLEPLSTVAGGHFTLRLLATEKDEELAHAEPRGSALVATRSAGEEPESVTVEVAIRLDSDATAPQDGRAPRRAAPRYRLTIDH